MSSANTIVVRRVAATWFALVVISSLFLVVPRAEAAPAPVEQPGATAMSADRLPTVQIDGVVWSQAVIGNTVYAGGRFNNARPAGAAPGTNLTPRANLLAYDPADREPDHLVQPESERPGPVGCGVTGRQPPLRRR